MARWYREFCGSTASRWVRPTPAVHGCHGISRQRPFEPAHRSNGGVDARRRNMAARQSNNSKRGEDRATSAGASLDVGFHGFMLSTCDRRGSKVRLSWDDISGVVVV